MGTEERKVREIRDEKRNNVYGTAVRRAVAGIVLFAAAFLLLFGASASEAFAQWYTLHVYSFFVATLGRFCGIFAFSVSELMLYVLAAFLVWQIVRAVYRCWKERRVGQPLAAFFSGAFLAAGILFVLYAAFCGVNYHRSSFAHEAGLTWEGASVDELRAVCEDLTSAVNRTGQQVHRDEEGIMVLTEDVSVRAVRAMEKLAGEYPLPGGLLPTAQWPGVFLAPVCAEADRHLLPFYHRGKLQCGYGPLQYSFYSLP